MEEETMHIVMEFAEQGDLYKARIFVFYLLDS